MTILSKMQKLLSYFIKLAIGANGSVGSDKLYRTLVL